MIRRFCEQSDLVQPPLPRHEGLRAVMRSKKKPPEYFACPECGGGVDAVGEDRNGNVYECDVCGKKSGEQALELRYKKRRGRH